MVVHTSFLSTCLLSVVWIWILFGQYGPLEQAVEKVLRKDQPKINRIKLASTFQHHSDSLG